MVSLSTAISSHLHQPYALSEEQINFYRENRFIKLKNVLNVETIQFFNDAITKQVNEMNEEHTALENRTTYGKAFLQLFNLYFLCKFVLKL